MDRSTSRELGAIPYVTDFGLAKRIDVERSLTETGAQLGTAGYMSPEQAMGKKGLTFATDVFSLGAILYERFTGKMAFPGATLLERIRALDNAPSRPTTLMPTLHRDLETVSLKCLEREPEKCNETAADLADDLSRWLKGEPIVARPATKMERLWMWCRRNPAIAGWAGTAVVAIGVGAAATTYMTVRAGQHLAFANRKTEEAKQAIRRFVQTLIQTLGVVVNSERTPTERWAIFEIAKQDDEFKAQVLSEVFATDKPEFPEKFARASEHAVQAAVGPSDNRRQIALRIARSKLSDVAATADQRFAAMTLALELGADDIDIPEWTGEAWLAANKECPWIVAVDRLSDSQCRLLAPHWLKVLERTENAQVIAWASDGCAQLDQPAAIRASDGLVAVLGKTTDWPALQAAGQGLTALAAQLAQPAAILAKLGEARISSFRAMRDRGETAAIDWDCLEFLIDQFDAQVIGSIALGDFVTVDNMNHESFGLRPGVYSSCKDLVLAAQWLRHPACVGEIRQQVLHRLEELAFPPSDASKDQALQDSVVTGMTEPMASGLLAATRQAKWERERKFRTIWDAVDWLHKNRPDIAKTLDEPYRPRR